MGAHNPLRIGWRAARHIRRLAELGLHEMQVIEPRWAYFEDAELDLTVDDLRPLLDHPALAPAAGVVAFTILSLERRPAHAVAAALGGVSTTCVSRWRSLGRDLPPRLIPDVVALAKRWPG